MNIDVLVSWRTDFSVIGPSCDMSTGHPETGDDDKNRGNGLIQSGRCLPQAGHETWLSKVSNTGGMVIYSGSPSHRVLGELVRYEHSRCQVLSQPVGTVYICEVSLYKMLIYPLVEWFTGYRFL